MGPLQVGTTLSQKYKIERLLAESGGTVLYEATDTARAKRVWIKILQRESLGDAAALARFQREAAGDKVLDVGKSDAGLPYLVATEFGPPEKRAMPPRPKASKTTLRGVAPPPPAVPSRPPKKEVEEELDDVDVEEAPPTPAPAGIFSTPPADSNPILASPLVTTPLLKLECVPEPEAAGAIDVPMPVVELPPPTRLPALTPTPAPIPRRKPASATPTVFIEGRQKKASQTSMWVVALLLVAVATGMSGWYFGHKAARVTAAPPPPLPITTTTTTVAAATTEVAPIPIPTPTPTPIPTPTMTATATATATTATATATPSPPKPKPPPRRPVPTAHPQSGDPLTL